MKSTRRRLAYVVILVILGYGVFLLVQAEWSAPPQTSIGGPKLLHTPFVLAFPEGFQILNVTGTLNTYDAYAAFNPINLSMKVRLGPIPVGSQVLLVLVPFPFSLTAIGNQTSQVPLRTFLLSEDLAHNVMNLTRPGLIFPGSLIDASQTFSTPESGDFTLLGVALQRGEPPTFATSTTKMVTLGTYSEYSQVVSNRLTAQISNGIAAQVRSGDVMEALTWILVAFTLVTILLEVRRR